jgi:hypothetical protein
VVLALAIIAFLFDGVTGYQLWTGAMALGAIFVLFQSGAPLLRRLKPRTPHWTPSTGAGET